MVHELNIYLRILVYVALCWLTRYIIGWIPTNFYFFGTQVFIKITEFGELYFEKTLLERLLDWP